VSHEAEYLIVAGTAWLRRAAERAWAVTFGPANVRSGTAASWLLSATRAEGELDDLAWELTLEELAPPFRTPHPALRPVASSHLETWPALLVSGRIGERTLDGVPGHRARLWGRRGARAWAWAHGSDADGRWAHLLAAKVPGLPWVAQYATDLRPPGLPLARRSVDGTRVRIGPLRVEAAGEEVELAYPEGVTVRHWQPVTLSGPDASFEAAALELASPTLSA
jgi:hypothetical protein